jgi:hypothetical protein
VANGNYMKIRIFDLNQEEGVICGDTKIRKYITKYYKNLFDLLARYQRDGLMALLCESKLRDNNIYFLRAVMRNEFNNTS